MEVFNEKKLKSEMNIHTEGTQVYDINIYRYEPTPYAILDEIVKLKWLHHDNIVLDVGSGKGRVAFYLNNKIGCRVIGVEIIEELYNESVVNLERYKVQNSSQDILFVKSNILDAKILVDEKWDVLYSFNSIPSEQMKMLITRMWVDAVSDVGEKKVILYYPENEIIKYLRSSVIPCDIIVNDCKDLKVGPYDNRNRLYLITIR